MFAAAVASPPEKDKPLADRIARLERTVEALVIWLAHAQPSPLTRSQAIVLLEKLDL